MTTVSKDTVRDEDNQRGAYRSLGGGGRGVRILSATKIALPLEPRDLIKHKIREKFK